MGLVSTLFSLPHSHPLFGPGGTLWSHLLSQAHFQHSGLKPDSAREKSKVQLNTHLCLMTPAKLPQGRSLGQERFPVEPPRTSRSLPPAKEIPSPRDLQKEADSQPSARTSLLCSSDLTEAPWGHVRSQIRRAGQSSNPAPNRRLHWVREGADRVLGAYGRGRGQKPPSASRASPGCGRAVWSPREEQVKQWAAEMLVALEALHEQGVLCRDLNPQNLLLDQAGRSPSLSAPALPLRWEPRVNRTPAPEIIRLQRRFSPLPFFRLAPYRGPKPGATAPGTPLSPGQQGAVPLGRPHSG